MSAPLVTPGRDALAKALHHIDPFDPQEEIDPAACGECARCVAEADHLIASGALIGAATLADDEDFAERVCELMGLDPEFGVMDVCHVLSKTAVALAERGEQHG